MSQFGKDWDKLRMRIKELRKQFGYTQKQLAEMLETTQQTVGRWEAGKAEPNLAALRDIALIFGVSVDTLLGRPMAGKETVWPQIALQDADLSGYWGNVGLLHPADQKTKWYPVSGKEMRVVYSAVQAAGRTGIPACFRSLNNRLVVFRPQALSRVWFLNDACDAPDGDWDVGPDEVEGMPSEFYAGLEMYLNERHSGCRNWEASISERYRKVVTGFVKEYKLDDTAIQRMVENTLVRTVGGHVFEYAADPSDIVNLACSCDDPEFGERHPFFRLSSAWGEFETFFHWDQLALVDSPLRQFCAAFEEELENG